MMLVNGVDTTNVSALDRGLQYGDGVFETIAVRLGELLLWDLHWARLQRGCERLKIALPNESDIEQDVRRVLDHTTNQVLKIVITRGISERGYRPSNGPVTRVVSTSSWPKFPAPNHRDGINVRVCEWRLSQQPQLAGLKHLNRLDNVMARSEWNDENIGEGLMLDQNGHVVEGTMSNVFIVENGQLSTPKLDSCGVAGVMREAILRYAIREKRTIAETNLDLPRMLNADEVFICNSLIGVWAVRRVGEKAYDVNRYRVTPMVQQWVASDTVI